MKFKERLYQIFSRFGVRLFIKIFPEYFAKEPLSPNDRYLENSFIIKNLPRPPAKVLDAGCTGSYFALLLASFGYDTHGIDVRNYPILNRIKFDNFTFTKTDIRKTSFPDNFFDAITAVSTVEHIGLSGRYGMDDNIDGDEIALREIKRVLKPGGVLLLTVPFGKAKIVKPFHKIYDGAQIKNLIKEFRIVKDEYYMQDTQDNWYRCSLEEAERVDTQYDKIPLCLLKLVK